MLLAVIAWSVCCCSVAQNASFGTLLVLNKADNNMMIFDVGNATLVATIPTGDGPHEITVSGDGKFAFVANYGSKTPGHSLSVIDIAARKEVRRVELGPLLKPHGIEARGNKIYFISELTRTVACYDFAADKLSWLTGTGQDGGHMIVLTPDGKRLYTANRVSNTVSSIDIGDADAPGALVQITTGSRPEGIAVSNDGKELWVGNTADGTITVVDIPSNRVKHTFAVGKVPIRIKFTPDGKRVLVSDNGAEELIVIDAGSRKVLKRIAVTGAPVGLLVTPNGKIAYIARSGSGRVSVLDLATLTLTGQLATGNAPDGMGWVE